MLLLFLIISIVVKYKNIIINKNEKELFKKLKAGTRTYLNNLWVRIIFTAAGRKTGGMLETIQLLSCSFMCTEHYILWVKDHFFNMNLEFSPFNSGASSCNWRCALGYGDIGWLLVINDSWQFGRAPKNTTFTWEFFNSHGVWKWFPNFFLLLLQGQTQRLTPKFWELHNVENWIERLWE